VNAQLDITKKREPMSVFLVMRTVLRALVVRLISVLIVVIQMQSLMLENANVHLATSTAMILII
jgi:hypothetical protein